MLWRQHDPSVPPLWPFNLDRKVTIEKTKTKKTYDVIK